MKTARVEIEWHKFADGTQNHQPVIYTDGKRIALPARETRAEAYADGELYLAKHGLLHDYRSVEYDRCGRRLIGRW